jgi:predicted lipoprotein with Yx(FWY)xxD motif
MEKPMSRTLIATALAALATTSAAAADAPAAPHDGVLATPSGATVYTFDKDTVGSGKSACNGPCAQLWPPVAAKSTDMADGDWSIVTRDDGSRQWAYKGAPVYTFSKDAKPGDTSGDKFKDVWHVIKG